MDESLGMDLNVCFLFYWYEVRDNGQVIHNEEFEECHKGNDEFWSYQFYDDGYGNIIDYHIIKTVSFQLTKGGEVIYSGTEEPESGSIHNGYQIYIVRKQQ